MQGTQGTQVTTEKRRGMTTAQMAVLWYAVLLIEGILILAGTAATSDVGAPLLLGSAIVIFAGTLIYTLRPDAPANKRKLARIVVIPVWCIAVALGMLAAASWLRDRDWGFRLFIGFFVVLSGGLALGMTRVLFHRGSRR